MRISISPPETARAWSAWKPSSPVETEKEPPVYSMEALKEELLDQVFPMVAESVEEAVLNSLAAASTVTGYDGTTKYSLADVYLSRLPEQGTKA